MKGIYGLLLACAVAFGGLLIAQTPATPQKIGYINSQSVVEAHSGFAKVKDIQTRGNAELKPLRDQITPIEAKIRAGNATAKEQQDYQVLGTSIQQTAKKWQDQQAAALKPITEAIDAAVAKLAKEQGFAMILDAKVAGDSGLVIYADAGLDVTEAVKKAIQ